MPRAGGGRVGLPIAGACCSISHAVSAACSHETKLPLLSAHVAGAAENHSANIIVIITSAACRIIAAADHLVELRAGSTLRHSRTNRRSEILVDSGNTRFTVLE